MDELFAEKKDILTAENNVLADEISNSKTQFEELMINLTKELKSLELLKSSVETKNKENNSFVVDR